MRKRGRLSLVPETDKKSGVAYAWTDDGLELPVVDVTNPAFHITLNNETVERLAEETVRALERQDKMPRFMRRIFLSVMLRGSLLARGISRARGGHLDALGTYLLKLGAENLGSAYARPVDRVIAATLPSLSVRLRLQDMATLIAEGVAGKLDERPEAALHFVNVAGGTAADTLNALLLLRARRAESLLARRIEIHVLDQDEHGPSFGARALEALRTSGGPLEGLDISLSHFPYDWADPSALRRIIPELNLDGAIVSASSEGGLFEYGSDQDVIKNLRALAEAAPAAGPFVGTLSRCDGLRRRINESGGAALVLRELSHFESVVAQAGWRIVRTLECPLSYTVSLARSG